MRLHCWNYTGNYLERECWRLTIRTMNINGETWHMVPWLRHFFYGHVEAHAPCHLQKCREKKHVGTEMQRCGGEEVEECEGTGVLRCKGMEMRKCRGVEMWRCGGAKMWRCGDAGEQKCGDAEIER